MFKPSDEGLSFLDPLFGWVEVLRVFPSGSALVREATGSEWLFDRTMKPALSSKEPKSRGGKRE